MLLEMLQDQLKGRNLSRLSGQLGADEGATGRAVSSAIPLLLGALARNSANSAGASSLASALDRDHDGSIMDNLSGFLTSGGSGANGSGILRHVFGGTRPAVEKTVSQSSGLSQGSTAQLLEMLAPLVMGALGRTKKQGNLGGGGLADLLNQESNHVRSTPAGGLLSLLDADGDGSVIDDVGGMLGRFLK